MKKILVVDDEKPISDIIKFNMAKEGYAYLLDQVDWLGILKEWYYLLKRGWFPLVLTSFFMTEEDVNKMKAF